MLKKIISWADNRLNPVAVKELRQSTNSRVLTTLVIAFLAVQLFFLYLQIFLNDATSFDKRQVIFPTVLMVLVGACIYGIIPSISNRFFKELNGDSIDLIYTTVLSPFAIISGKTLSAIGMIILLYSLCAPFIFISYLFPGIDILTIFWSLWYSFWIIVSVSQLMILVAAMKTSKIMRGIILLIYFGGISIFGIGFLQSMSFGLGRTGIFGYGLVPFYAHLIFLLFWLLLIGFLYVLAVAAVTSTHANRALWPRAYAAGFWFIGLLYVLGLYMFASTPAARAGAGAWTILSTAIFLVFMGAASGERAEYGNRLRRYIPRNKLLRSLVFPFFSGEINGIIYAIIFLVLTVGIFFLLPQRTSYSDRHLTVIIGLAGYFTWYSLLSLQIKRMLVNRFPNISSFLIMLFLIISLTLIPMMLAWGIYRTADLREEQMAPFLILSFGLMLMKEYANIGLAVSWSAAAITFLVLWSFLKRRIKEFKPLERTISENKDAVSDEQ